MSHGDRVVYIVARPVDRCGQAPGVLERIGLAMSDGTALLGPRRFAADPHHLAVDTRAAPIGTPPSARPMRACSICMRQELTVALVGCPSRQ